MKPSNSSDRSIKSDRLLDGLRYFLSILEQDFTNSGRSLLVKLNRFRFEVSGWTRSRGKVPEPVLSTNERSAVHSPTTCFVRVGM